MLTSIDEAARLRSLISYGVLDTPGDERFDRLTRLTAELFDAPIALVSLVDADRQWFKSKFGLDATQTPRCDAFCAHAIEPQFAGSMVVEDATLDSRFSANPLVTGQPKIRFYAGAVLTSPDGCNLGTLCVIDTEPRPTPSVKLLARLKVLASIVVDELELCRALRGVEERERLLNLAEKTAGLGYWRMTSCDSQITWSPEMYAIYGLDPNRPLDLSALMAMTHPDDARDADARLGRALQGIECTNSITRIYRPNGDVRYLSGNLAVERGATNAISAVVGTLTDVTESRRSVEALAASELQYRQLAENAADIIMFSDLSGVVTYVSPSIVARTGFSPGDVEGRPALDQIDSRDAPAIQAAVIEQIKSRGATPPRTVEYRAKHKNGSEIWFEATPTLVIDGSGRMTGVTDVIRDITARVVLEQQLRGAQETAQAAALVKSEFLANMSHELRTPLTSIIGFSGLVAAQQDLPQAARVFIDRVSDASQALLCTVNDILDFSKLESGQVVIASQPASPAAVCQSSLDLFTPQAGAKDLALEFNNQAPRDLVVNIDPDRLRQVLLNLVGNAVKFTDSGNVTLTLRYDAARTILRVEVKDTGAGICDEDQVKLFQRFSQIDGSLTRKSGGTGLGLAICKGLIEAMGGGIGVSSAVGTGSCFWFELPAEQIESSSISPSRSRRVSNTDLQGTRVLVADDHPANRELVRLFLSAIGVEVTHAEDGQAAIALADERPFDVILLDMRMPNIDGPAACRAIRRGGGPNDNTPIIAFTAEADGHGGYDYLALGFDAVLFKPVDATSLILEIARAVHFDPEDQTGAADHG